MHSGQTPRLAVTHLLIARANGSADVETVTGRPGYAERGDP
ncbi:hypothetical protein [Arthrobacter sp. PAMC25284]|nr:hypothetical protein [Arthrobacter sp. PAMC25284]